MRLFLFVAFGLSACFASSLQDVVKSAAKSDGIAAKEYLANAYKKSSDAASSKLYPKIDLSYKTLQYSEQPYMYANMPPLLNNAQMHTGPKNYFDGEISVSYPIFRGFGIDAFVKKAKLEAKKAELEKEDAKRNTYANAVSLFFAISSLQESETAYMTAMQSAKNSLDKATGLYAEGFVGVYEVENIKSKYYEISADTIEIKNKKEMLINTLWRLSGLRIESADDVKALFWPNKEAAIKEALEQREDVVAVKTLLDIGDEEIRYAKSKFYPTIDFVAAAKRIGDSSKLDGDGFSNKDKSYALIALGFNIFDGGESSGALEAAKAKKMAAAMMYSDYKNGVKAEIENLFLELESARKREDAFTKNVNAANEFYKLTNARFENRLVGTDELSRSISNLAIAKSRLAGEKNRIKEIKIRILLETSLKKFENAIGGL